MVNKRRNNRKWIWWGIGLAIVAIIVTVGVVVWQNNRNGSGSGDDVSEIDNSDKEDNESGDKNKDGNGDGGDTNDDQKDLAEEVAEEKKVKQYEGDDPNVANELGGVVSYAGVENGVLVIRTNIDQFLTEGTCELSLLKNGSTVYNGSARIMADVSTSTCDGFDIPVSKIGSGGVEIVIKLKAGDKGGEIRGTANV